MENIKVLRKQVTETKELMVGDQISISLKGLGDFTATAHKITDKGVLFIFDECVASIPMNEKNTNDGGYEKSDLKSWFDSVLLGAFPSELRGRIIGLSIPTIGELFGHNNFYENFEPDDDDQLKLMEVRRNRICIIENGAYWWWLRNAVNEESSSIDFAVVIANGDFTYDDSTSPNGVRPEFWLVR